MSQKSILHRTLSYIIATTMKKCNRMALKWLREAFVILSVRRKLFCIAPKEGEKLICLHTSTHSFLPSWFPLGQSWFSSVSGTILRSGLCISILSITSLLLLCLSKKSLSQPMSFNFFFFFSDSLPRTTGREECVKSCVMFSGLPVQITALTCTHLSHYFCDHRRADSHLNNTISAVDGTCFKSFHLQLI